MMSEFEKYQKNRKTNEILELLKKEADGLGVFLNIEAIHLFSFYLGGLKTGKKKINLFRRKDD